jgi:hypothetical protein
MAEILKFRINWNHENHPQQAMRVFYTIHVDPSPEYPFGQKGKCIYNAWKGLADPTGQPTTDGVIILDADVMIDPDMMSKMETAVHNDPDWVHVAPVKIFPISTKFQTWCWAHWSDYKSQVLEYDNVKWFSFNFTYLPRAVITKAIETGLKDWRYPVVDKNMAIAANKIGVKVNVLKDVYPVHLNY